VPATRRLLASGFIRLRKPVGLPLALAAGSCPEIADAEGVEATGGDRRPCGGGEVLGEVLGDAARQLRLLDLPRGLLTRPDDEEEPFCGER
jgi:hypothetical protein